jgi:hypothetical protein
VVIREAVIKALEMGAKVLIKEPSVPAATSVALTGEYCLQPALEVMSAMTIALQEVIYEPVDGSDMIAIRKRFRAITNYRRLFM